MAENLRKAKCQIITKQRIGVATMISMRPWPKIGASVGLGDKMLRWRRTLEHMEMKELKKLVKVGVLALSKSRRSIFSRNMAAALKGSGRLRVANMRIGSELFVVPKVLRSFRREVHRTLDRSRSGSGIVLVHVHMQEKAGKTIMDQLVDAHHWSRRKVEDWK